MFGLIGVGHRLAEARRLWPVLLGLGVVYLTAVIYSHWQGVDWLSGRLLHPYLTATSLGVAGAYGVWLCLFLPGRWEWRAPGALVSLGVILASGSRGPLIAAAVGVLAGLLMGRNRRWWLAAGATIATAALLTAILLGQRAQIATLERFQQLDLAGRQVIWQNTLALIRDVPLGGVGSYRVGTVLAPPSDCYLFSSVERTETCPAWVQVSGQPWIIAHNGALHQWAETGPLGVLGLMSLLGAALFIGLRRRDALVVAAATGIVLTNIIDNTWIVPGPLSGELFWILLGTQFRHFQREDLPGTSLTGTAILAILALPALAMTLPSTAGSPLNLRLFAAAPTFTPGEPYRLVMQVQGQSGRYAVSLNSCTLGCRPVRTTALAVTPEGGTLQIPDLLLGNEPQQRLELRVYADGPLALRPLAVYQWSVKAEAAASSVDE